MYLFPSCLLSIGQLSCLEILPMSRSLRYRFVVARLLGLRVRSQLKAQMLVSCVCCVLCRYRHLWRADHSFRGVLLGVCFCLWPRELNNERPRLELDCCVTEYKCLCISANTLHKRTSLSDRLQIKFLIYLQPTIQFTEVSMKETKRRIKIHIYLDKKKSQNKKYNVIFNNLMMTTFWSKTTKRSWQHVTLS